MDPVSDLGFRASDLAGMVEELKYAQIQVFGVEDEPKDLEEEVEDDDEDEDEDDEDEDEEDDKEEEEDGWQN